MFSTLLMGGGGHTREKDHQNVKSLIIFAHDCRGEIINRLLLSVIQRSRSLEHVINTKILLKIVQNTAH